MKIDNLLGDKDPCINMKLFLVLSAFIELLYYIFFKLHLESNKLAISSVHTKLVFVRKIIYYPLSYITIFGIVSKSDFVGDIFPTAIYI